MISQAKRQARSYRYAAKGVRYTLSTQINIWVHLVSAGAVICLGLVLHFSVEKMLLVVLAIGLVLAAELLNTAIEVMVDLLSPEYAEKAGIVKDVAAGGVLAAAVCASIVGISLFGPPLFSLLIGQ